MKKTIMFVLSAIAALTISSVAFAADDEAKIGSAVWSDGINMYTADESGNISAVPCGTVRTVNGPAVMADESGTYITYEDGAVCVYPSTYAYIIDGLYLSVFKDNTLQSVLTCIPEFADFGIKTWTDGVNYYTENVNGEIGVMPCEPAFAGIDTAAAALVSDQAAYACDIGPAIWADDYATYTADGSGAVIVYPHEDADHPVCVHDDGYSHCLCGFCPPCAYGIR